MSMRVKASSRFTVGMRVRVRSGVVDPDFPDIPLGGWVGTVRELDPTSRKIICLIEWDEATLLHAHPLFRKRCERDGLEYERMWLEESDLEPDTGEALSIEHPRQVVSRPLSEDDDEDRIRMALGLTSDDPLPDVNDETLRAYHRYLAGRLAFPFAGEYSEETCLLEGATYLVQAIRLLDPDECDDSEGLLVRARRGWETIVLPLAEVEVAEGSPNWRWIEDYSSWFGG